MEAARKNDNVAGGALQRTPMPARSFSRVLRHPIGEFTRSRFSASNSNRSKTTAPTTYFATGAIPPHKDDSRDASAADATTPVSNADATQTSSDAPMASDSERFMVNDNTERSLVESLTDDFESAHRNMLDANEKVRSVAAMMRATNNTALMEHIIKLRGEIEDLIEEIALKDHKIEEMEAWAANARKPEEDTVFFIAPMSGSCYHKDRFCKGLVSAYNVRHATFREVASRTSCQNCC